MYVVNESILNTNINAVAKTESIVSWLIFIRIALNTFVSIGILTKKSNIWIVYH